MVEEKTNKSGGGQMSEKGEGELTTKDRIEIGLEEYRTLREESLQSMKHRNTILALGMATIGVLFHAAINSAMGNNSSPWITLAVLGVGIPSVVCFALLLWLGESQRMSRCGDYLVTLEKKINELGHVAGKRRLLKWEGQLRSKEAGKNANQMKYPYVAVIALFLGSAVGALSIAWFFAYSTLEVRSGLPYLTAPTAVFVLVVAWFVYMKGRALP